jgi:hypothetical protein
VGQGGHFHVSAPWFGRRISRHPLRRLCVGRCRRERALDRVSACFVSETTKRISIKCDIWKDVYTKYCGIILILGRIGEMYFLRKMKWNLKKATPCPLQAMEAYIHLVLYKVCRFVTMLYYYNCHNSQAMEAYRRLVLYKVCRFVSMLYYYNYHNSGYHPSSWWTMFRIVIVIIFKMANLIKH